MSGGNSQHWLVDGFDMSVLEYSFVASEIDQSACSIMSSYADWLVIIIISCLHLVVLVLWIILYITSLYLSLLFFLL